MNERETFGQRTHGKLVNFPRPLTATCRLFYYEMSGLPYTLSYQQQWRLETEDQRRIPNLEAVRILTRKVLIAWEPQLRFHWSQMLMRIRGIKRVHFCVLLAADMVATWLEDSDRRVWENGIKTQVASILPHAGVVFEWEFAGPVEPAKTWAAVAR